MRMKFVASPAKKTLLGVEEQELKFDHRWVRANWNCPRTSLRGSHQANKELHGAVHEHPFPTAVLCVSWITWNKLKMKSNSIACDLRPNPVLT